jgi:hypothetical protein
VHEQAMHYEIFCDGTLIARPSKIAAPYGGHGPGALPRIDPGQTFRPYFAAAPNGIYSSSSSCAAIRKERSILTSNQSLGAWGKVFGDSVVASAILDRLLHHSMTVNIRGKSYRLEEKLKAALLKSKLPPEALASEKIRPKWPQMCIPMKSPPIPKQSGTQSVQIGTPRSRSEATLGFCT